MSNSNTPILYSFRRCPYAMRGRMALFIAGVKCEIREILLKDKPDEMVSISNKGTVPVLQLPGGEVIDESLDVMMWALNKSDPEQWLQGDQDLTRILIERNDGEFKDKLDRYKYFVRYPEYSQQYYRQQAETFLAELEDYLEANEGGGLVGHRLSLADFAIFPFIRQFSAVDADWFNSTAYTNLKQWKQGIETGVLFKSVMKKYTPWSNNGKIQFFP